MRRFTFYFCAGALLVGASACSDDSSTSADTTSSTTSTTVADTGPKNIESFDIAEAVPPGTYFTDPDGDPSTPFKVVFDITADGWTGGVAGPAKFHPAGHTGLSFVIVGNVAKDACKDPAPRDPAVGPSVDELASALAGLPPFELTEPPTQVSLLGHHGKHLKITVPALTISGSGDEAHYADCVDGNLQTWIEAGADEPYFGYNAEPGRYDDYSILDVDGTRLMIAINTSPAMPPEDIAEAHAIISSIRFDT